MYHLKHISNYCTQTGCVSIENSEANVIDAAETWRGVVFREDLVVGGDPHGKQQKIGRGGE